MKRKAKIQNRKIEAHSQSALPTFMDHVRELQGRLFAIVLAFVLAAAAAYPFFDKIVTLVVAPLDKSQQLVYLTPGGAFSFIIKICMYIGAIGALPVIIFHFYRFLMPAVRRVHLRTVLFYTLWSCILAMAGVVFAYVVSLPAALHFLTSFNLYHIDPMLTIDSYLSFVMTYLLAGALLFQLPLLMLIINSVTPLTPGRLMNYQRHILVGSFVVAAIITPTPDVMNQVLIASPIVVMYQLGIVLIWLRNIKQRRRPTSVPERAATTSLLVASAPAPTPLVVMPVQQHSVPLPRSQVAAPRRIDGFGRVQRQTASPRPSPAMLQSPSVRHLAVTRPDRPRVYRSLDGFSIPARS